MPYSINTKRILNMKDFEKYEELVSLLIKTKLMEGLPTSRYEVFRQKKYFGKSGQPHTIDVSIEVEIAGIKILIIIECKQYSKKKVGVGIVNELYGRIQDIGAHKAIVITPTGFQKGALTTAKSYGIACVIVNDLVGQLLIGDPGFYFEQSEKLNNYLKKNTNKPLPDKIKNNLHLFLPEFNSTNEFCETDKKGYDRFIEYGFTIVEENEPSFTLNANGLINFWVICLYSMNIN
jgi:hypothetical protein